DWNAGGEAFRRAIQLAPGDATPHYNYSNWLLTQKRFDEASAEIGKALAIDPLSPRLQTTSLFPLYEGRRYDDAIAAGRKLLREDSTLGHVRFIVAQALLGKGEPEQAIAEARIAATHGALSGWRSLLAFAYATSGHRDSALAIVGQLRAVGRDEYLGP